MAKYEIMLVINGKLNEADANKAAGELKALISTNDTKNLKETPYGLKTMAYSINKTNQGFYYQYNFETEIPAVVNEFRRLALINKNVLRHLIINLEKDYGYRAINNPKKVKKSAKKLVIYTEKKKRLEAEYKIKKLAREAEGSTSNE